MSSQNERPPPGGSTVQTMVHKGEVLVIWSPGTAFLSFDPATARSFAEGIKTAASAAEGNEKVPAGVGKQ